MPRPYLTLGAIGGSYLRVMLRLDGHLINVIADGVLAKTPTIASPCWRPRQDARRPDRPYAVAGAGPRTCQRPAQGLRDGGIMDTQAANSS
jgi:hypothetical protein